MEAAPPRLPSAIWSEPTAQQSGEPSAKIQCGSFRGHLPTDDPATGLHGVSVAGIALPGSVLRVSGIKTRLAAPVESYVRGDDRVSTHPATESLPFRTQLYWSAQPLAGGVVVVTLTVSLQTDLLDTRPELSFTTGIEKATVSLLGGDACRLDTATAPSVVVTPHPTDALECDATAAGEEAILRFSSPFLEKGVIRRCRVAAIFLPSQADESSIAGAIAEFAATPLPLTT